MAIPVGGVVRTVKAGAIVKVSLDLKDPAEAKKRTARPMPPSMSSGKATGKALHPLGGVCPFGLPKPLPVYCDVTLKAFDEVVPAAGATNAAVRLSPQRMAELIGAEWVDV